MDIGLENKAYAGGTEISMKILFLWKQHSSVLLYNVLYSLTCCPAASRRGRNSTAVGFRCVSLQGVGMLDWAFYESSACSQFRCPNNAISSNEQFFYHPHGPLISVSLIRLNDNNVSYGQAVRFGVMFQLMPLSLKAPSYCVVHRHHVLS